MAMEGASETSDIPEEEDGHPGNVYVSQVGVTPKRQTTPRQSGHGRWIH